MENILQSLVKIIIIGALYDKTNVDCNRQFLAGPPPYYQNEDYYIPSFAPAYQNQPIYYQEQNIPPPISYHNFNSYTPPQLFYQNENYIPPPVANSGVRYTLPYKQNLQRFWKPQQNFGYPRVEYKKPPEPQVVRPQETSLKKSEAFASNIIVKDEPLTPYYQDDYNKNYNDEDYSENYSDESPVTPRPCSPNSPYRFFEASKEALNIGSKYPPCNPNFQPNFGNNVYTVKMPITLLPSRFPPRVEQLIERIQNYFSTYTEQQQLKPQNETSPSSTPQTATEISNGSASQLSATEEVFKKNETGENQEVQSTEAATVGNMEQVTEKTTVVEIKMGEPERFSTTAPDAQSEKESQMKKQTTQRIDDVAVSVSVANTEKLQSNEGTAAEAQVPQSEDPIFKNQPLNESIHSGEEKIVKANEERELLHVQDLTTPPDVSKTSKVTDVTSTTSSFHDVSNNNG